MSNSAFMTFLTGLAGSFAGQPDVSVRRERTRLRERMTVLIEKCEAREMARKLAPKTDTMIEPNAPRDPFAALRIARAQEQLLPHSMQEEIDRLRAENNQAQIYLREAYKKSAEWEDQAEILRDAIQFAVFLNPGKYDAMAWLEDWNLGCPQSDEELQNWRKANAKRGQAEDVRSEAVVGRNGLHPVPPAVGHERSEPAIMSACEVAAARNTAHAGEKSQPENMASVAEDTQRMRNSLRFSGFDDRL